MNKALVEYIFKHKITGILFVLYVLLGMVIRWRCWLAKDSQYDIGDYGEFGWISFHMKDSYDTGVREPLWCWILKIWFIVTNTQSFDASFYIAQALDFIWFPIILFLSMLFCEGYLGKWQSWIIGWILAMSNYQIFHELSGLREPLETIFILILLFALIRKDNLPIWNLGKKWALVVISSALMLTRVGYVQVLFIVLPLFFWLNAWPLRHCFFILLISFLFVIPYYQNNFINYGNPQYFSNKNLGIFWARDFQHRKGFPYNKSQLEKTEHHFPPLTLSQYLSRRHKWHQIPEVVLSGIYKIFFYYPNVSGLLIWRFPLEKYVKKMSPFHAAVMFFYLMGYYSLLRENGKRRFVIFMFIVMAPYYLFGHIQVVLRYALCVAPLFLMILSHGMVQTLAKAGTLRKVFKFEVST